MIEYIMKKYDEALSELMGAQEYKKAAKMTEDSDERRMYIQLSRQELSHAAMFQARAESCANSSEDDSAKKVWHHLKGHIDDWASDISSCLDKMERM